MTNDEFAELVLGAGGNAGPVVPTAYYDANGDCIEFLAKHVPFYAKRIDALVTVYLSEETGEIVGSLIKGVSDILKELPGLKIDIHDGRIQVVHLIRAKMWSGPSDPPRDEVVTYRDLVRVAEESGAEADICVA